jgi:hypothetical protein
MCILDWNAFDMSGVKWLTGHEYESDVDCIKLNCDMNLVDKYYLAFFGLDNQAPSTIIKQASNKDVFYFATHLHMFMVNVYNTRYEAKC